jgi:3-oxoadipate enol-lactonase
LTRPAVHARLEGEAGAPVVVLAGSLGSTLAMWEPQLAALTPRFRVLRYDHPGHGRTPPAAGPLDLDALADPLLALLDDLGLDRVSFCGLSLGGMVGMTLAARAPERLDRLVLCCTSPRLGTAESWADRASTVRRGGMEAIADTVVERWFTPGFRAADEGTVASYRAMLLSVEPESYARCCEAIGAFDARERLAAVAASTLVIAGAEDPAIPAEDSRLLAEGIPGARLVVLDRAAHLANVERPEEFGQAVVNHLTGREADLSTR